MNYLELGFNRDITKSLTSSEEDSINPELMDFLLGDGSIGGNKITAGSIVADRISLGTRGFIQSIDYTAVDEDTASWDAGHIYTEDGTDITTASGNTGNITATTYLYYDSTKGSTLQKSLTHADAVGDDKLLLAIITEGDTGGQVGIQIFSGEGTLITPGNIITGVLTATTQLGSGGSGHIKLDGPNKRIIVNDGSNDRILIGYQVGGF